MSRTAWLFSLLAIIALGLASRLTHTGWILWDKYLGDALYAAMIYVIVRLIWFSASRLRVAVVAMAINTAIELFQLTLIPAGLLTNPHWIVRTCARLMGTEFSFLDLLTYAIGILCISGAGFSLRRASARP